MKSILTLIPKTLALLALAWPWAASFGALEYRIVTPEKGDRSDKLIRSIIIGGHNKTRENVILQALSIRPGQRYDYGRIRQAQRRLYRLGVFDQTVMRVRDVDEQQLDVEIELRERKPGWIAFRVGFDSIDMARASVRWGHDNIFGTARKVYFGGLAGTRAWEIGGGYSQPYFFRWELLTTYSLFYRRERFDNYRLRENGATFSWKRELTDVLDMYFGYELKRSRVFDVKSEAEVDLLDIENETRPNARVFVTFLNDTRNDKLVPTAGSRVIGTVSLANEVLGGRHNFYQLDLEGSVYKHLFGPIVGAFLLRLGYQAPIRGWDTIPTYERLYAGGATLVRGYKERHLGPLDSENDPVGGDKLVIFSTELRYPIYKDFSGVVFLDGGNVFAAMEEVSIDDFRYSTGLGLRFTNLIVPIRLDYGWKLDRRDGESAGALHFSLGHAF